MTSNNINYELESRHCRQYRINDPRTISYAIEHNIADYLAFCGIDQDRRVSDVRLIMGFISVLIGVGTYFAPVPFYSARGMLWAGIIAYNLIGACMFYVAKYLETNAFYVTSPASALAVAGRPKGKAAADTKCDTNASVAAIVDLLRGKRVRLMLEPAPSPSHHVKLTAELLDNASGNFWYRPARVLNKAAVEFSFGECFDSRGRFFPPPMKQRLHTLLGTLLEKTRQ
jgi:hypothetical protein